jgi:hypothetical protein
MHGAGRIAVADGTYFLANCLTFLLRFLLFHYVLFADSKSARRQPAVEQAQPTEATPRAAAADDPEPMANVTRDRS